MDNKLVDHLFRHQYGKMVAILTRIFGLSNMALIEDAVQDTFIQAMVKWRISIPENPEAWLTRAAKNRAVDLLRKVQADQIRSDRLTNGPSAIHLNELFLDHEIEDSQLRMIFVACHPSLKAPDQIAFSLKTISGFSTGEIAAALLTKEETIKKRLARARATIAEKNLKFEFPSATEVPVRMARVMEVIYLTFNEGFHSTNKEQLIREDLCGEAIRLCTLILKKENLRSPEMYALFALLCFHASRLESKVGPGNEIIDLKNQDRTTWYKPLMEMGHSAMIKALSTDQYSSYHLEAAIAAEHLKARTFDETNWETILKLYIKLDQLMSTPSSKLNIATVCLQTGDLKVTFDTLNRIVPEDLGQRAYLYFGCLAEYYVRSGNTVQAITEIDRAIDRVTNSLEKEFLIKKRLEIHGN